ADVLQSALTMLNAPERFDDEEKTSNQIVEQLNQWIRMVRETQGTKKAAEGAKSEARSADGVIAIDWQPDPLLETLPEALRRTRAARMAPIESFDPVLDGQFLREAAMLRDVANSIEPEN